MGQLLDGLTTQNSAVMDQKTGQPQFIGTPQQAQQQQQKDAYGIAAQPMGAPQAPGTGSPGTAPPIPKLGTPSFMQAAQTGAPPGASNPLSPGLNKAGKLAVLLQNGLQGAMAGRAASEQAVLQSGGHRSGGVGIGYEAGLAAPWQRAGMGEQFAQEQAKTKIMQQQGDMIQTPGGPMPLSLAKVFYPASIRAGAAENVQAQKGVVAENVQGQKSQTAKDVANINQGMQIPVDQSTARLAGFPELSGQSVGKGTWGNINKALEAKGYHTQDMGKNGTDENSGMWLMDKAGERISQVSPNSLTAQKSLTYTQNRGVQVADPDNPGNTKYETLGQAIKTGAAGPQSASVQIPKRAMASEVPTKMGDQKVAFTTMIQHADLLRDASRALSNGDVQALSGLKNAFKNEFGYSGPITAAAIADAYGGEVTNVISKGHITDAEMAKTGKTLDPSKQNFETIDKVLTAYQALAQSKMNMLNQQEQSAIRKSQPKQKGSVNSDLVNQLIQKHASSTASPTAR